MLDRLRLAHKLVLIALVLIAPALYATWQFRSQQNAQIAFSAKERVGIDEIVPAQRLLADLATARSLAVRAAGRDAEAITTLPAARAAVTRSAAALDAADARVGSQLGTRAMWKRLRASIRATVAAEPVDASRTLDAYDRLTAATVALIVQAGNESNLILDPDLDSYYAMDALVNKAPLALDTAGRVSSREIAMVASGPQHRGRADRARGRPGRARRAPSTPSHRPRARPTRTPPTATLRPTLDPGRWRRSRARPASLTLELSRAVHRGPDGTAATHLRQGRRRRASPTLQTRLAPALDRPARRPRRPPARQPRAAPTSSSASASRSPPTSSWPSSPP